MHMAAATLGCKRIMVGSRWANSHPGCMSRLRKNYSHFIEGSFWQGRLLGSECYLPTTILNAYEWAWLRSQVCLFCLKVH